MVAFVNTGSISSKKSVRFPLEPRSWQNRFLVLLPTIKSQTLFALRKLRRDQREEAMQEVIARVYAAYVALVKRGRESIAYPTPLVRFALAQYRDGRRLGSRLNINDVMSPYCQRIRGIRRETFDGFELRGDAWQEVLVENGKSTPADIAATRVDFCNWLNSLPPSKRRVTEALASGDTTKEAAAKFSLSQARVSQLRLELKRSWFQFHGVTC